MTTQEKLALESFFDIVSRIENLRFTKEIKDKNKLSVSFNFNKGLTSTIKTNVPSNEVISSYLIELRKMYMPSENVNLSYIVNLVNKYNLLDEPYISNVKGLKKQFHALINGANGIGINFNQQLLIKRKKDLIDLFLNGEFFHSDDEHYIKLRLLKATGTYEITRYEFVNSIIDLGEIILRVRNNLKHLKSPTSP